MNIVPLEYSILDEPKCVFN